MKESYSGYPSLDKPWLQYYSEEAKNERLPQGSLFDYLWDTNKQRLDDVALIFMEKGLSYREMFENIEVVYRAFLSYGISKGDIVGLCIPNIPEAIYIFYALNKIGAICNFVDPRANENVMTFHIRMAQTKLLITISDCYDIFVRIKDAAGLKNIVVLNVIESLSAYTDNNIKNETDCSWKQFLSTFTKYTSQSWCVDSETPNCILHTGGTTGIPKGALLSNKNFHSLVIQWKHLGLPYSPQNTLLSLMPPFVSFGLTANMHVPLCFGMTLILIPEYNPKKIINQIKQYKPNCIPASPAHWEEVFVSEEIRGMDLSFLKLAFVGGDIINPKLENGLNELFKITKANISLINAYGMTETTTAISVPSKNAIYSQGSVGIPLPQTIVGIFDDNCNERTYDELGEICVRSQSVMIEYYKSEETQEALKVHKDNNIWLHTGDIGYISRNGSLFIKGRKKRIIIRYDGIKIYPAEIEEKIEELPQVEKCVVVAQKDKKHLQGNVPVAFIVLESGEENVDGLLEYIKDFCDNNLDFPIETY